MWRDDGGRRRDGARLQERIRAIALMVGDSIEKFLHETLALLDSITRSDIASFIERLDTMQEGQVGTRSSLDAMAQTFAELLGEVRGLLADVTALRSGLDVDVGRLEQRVDDLESRDR